MFSVDIMVVFKDCSVAIEVLGPDHYTANTMAASVPGGNGRQQQQQQHVLLGSELLRFRLLSARGFALAAVSAFETSGMVATAAGTTALRKLLKQKLEEAVAIQQQYMAAQRTALSGSASADGAPDRQMRRQPQPQKQQQRQQGAGPSSNVDPQLSRLVTQAGYSQEQQRVRRSKAKYLEQRQQQYEQRGLSVKQEAMQTLLSAAGQASAAAAPASSVLGDGFAGVSDGFEVELPGVSDTFEERFERTAPDSEFDLPLDLDGLDLS
jgi:hypothetical protein